MQRVRIRKSIALIGFVAASLLLCSARFQPATKLYRAKPEDVPPWAEQGDFRFIRIDGGQIESWKAEPRTSAVRFCCSVDSFFFPPNTVRRMISRAACWRRASRARMPWSISASSVAIPRSRRITTGSEDQKPTKVRTHFSKATEGSASWNTSAMRRILP